MRHFAWLLIMSAAIGSPSIGQSTHQHNSAKAHQEVLGEIDFPNSGKPEAQADFLRAVKLLHNFEYYAAVIAFQAAQKIDPEFVLAYWGEAMAHNYSLWAEQQVDEAKSALDKLARTPSERAAKAKTPRERDYLAAVEALYGTGTKFERDNAYADRMDALAKAYPDDVEAQAFAALATLGRTNGIRDTANYERAGSMLEPMFPRYPYHPGVVHYIIHSYDDPDHAARGLAAAKVYDRLAPNSAHAQHMTSHIFLALGMWPEVERANVQARHAVEAAAGKPVPWAACGHGGQWLFYARLQQGLPVGSQVAECRKAATDLIASSKPPAPLVGSGGGASANMAELIVRQWVETGKWDAPFELPEGKQNLARFIFLYGDVLASRSDPAKATAALGRMRAVHEILTANFRKEFVDDDQTMPWMDLMLAQAEAVGLLAAGRQGEGMTALEAVAKRESAMPSAFGPPVLLKPSWELLGDERLAAGDKAKAAEAYRTSLKLQPGRSLSLAGLAKATS